MKQINIKPDETIIFERYFAQCDVTKTGRISPSEANKLFLKSGLPIEDLYKINEYCGANRLGYFGRSQFYIALKAIASAQAGEFVDEQIITHNDAVVLPRFDHQASADSVITIMQKSVFESSIIPPPPNKYHMRTLSGNNILHSLHQRSLMNRYPYRTSQCNDSLKGSTDKFNVKHNSFDQTYLTHNSFFESDDDENNDECYEEEDNKGLLNPNIKTEFDHLYSLNGDDVELSSSSDHESSSFTGGSEENEDMEKNGHCATGYTLMAAVEGLAVIPTDTDDTKAIPMATGEQLEYYTKCFQTIQSSDTGKVNGADAIGFFQLYHLDDEHIRKILSITEVLAETEVTLVQFSRAMHLITHQKTGFAIPDKVPDDLLPVSFEQPDEPFSFDLSTGEFADAHANNQLSSLDSSYSADGDTSSFDVLDVVVNRGWSKRKFPLSSNGHKTNRSYLSRSLNMSSADRREREDAPSCTTVVAAVSRPRPSAKRSLSFIPGTMNPVAPPPPPRSSIPGPLDHPHCYSVDTVLHPDDGPASSSSSSSSTSSSGHSSAAEEDGAASPPIHVSAESEAVATRKQSATSECRRQLLAVLKESKSRNHVLLRLNNEMTSELEELREQRVNLHLQLEYIQQSQMDN